MESRTPMWVCPRLAEEGDWKNHPGVKRGQCGQWASHSCTRDVIKTILRRAEDLWDHHHEEGRDGAEDDEKSWVCVAEAVEGAGGQSRASRPNK